MSDILIKNIEMPKPNERVFLTLSKEGLFEWDENKLEYVKIYNLVELQPHGDLISKKALEVQIAHAFHGNMFPDISAGLALNKVMNIITDAPHHRGGKRMTKGELFDFLRSELLGSRQEDIEIENCKIRGTNLGLENHDIMSLDLHLEGEGWGVSFGGYRMDGAYGMACLRELLETLEVGKYEDLKGMYVRCVGTGLGGRCLAVGHLLKDRWFSFGAFFNAHRECEDRENGMEAST